MNTILYFYNRNYRGNFYDARIESWIVEPTINSDGKQILTFRHLESLRIFSLTKFTASEVHCSFEHDYGNNQCQADWSSETISNFIKRQNQKSCYPMETIKKNQYNRLKKWMILTYANHPDLDFENLEVKKQNIGRLLSW